MSDVLDKYEDILPTVNPAFIRLAKIGLLMGFAGHLVGCFWYSAGLNRSNLAGPRRETGHSWLDEYCTGDGVDPDQCIKERPLPSRYLAAMYWAFTTMTTVG